MPADIELLVGGQAYRGWTSVSVTRAMDAAAGAFSLSFSDSDPENVSSYFVTPGAECVVKVDGEVLITGYLDQVSPTFGARQHSINAQGRDRTADIIDCSAVHRPDQWSNLDVLALARILCKPFGIPVSAEVPVGEKFASVKLQQGETAFEALDRHLRMRKLIAMPDGAGGLLITRTGRDRSEVPLVQGRGGNILSASGKLDSSARFSDYFVKGQAGYSDDTDGETEAHIEGRVRDPGVGRYRPKLIIAEAGGTGGSAIDRATWECNTSIGKATSASITVQGWRQKPGGRLWLPNMLVAVRSPWLRMDGLMLIRQVVYSRDVTGGTTAQLEIVSPQAYEPEPPKEKKAKAGKKQKGDQWGELAAAVAAGGDDE